MQTPTKPDETLAELQQQLTAERQASASWLQRVKEEKERINRLRCDISGGGGRSSTKLQPSERRQRNYSPVSEAGRDNPETQMRTANPDERTSAQLPHRTPLVAGGLSLCTVALVTAAVGCFLLSLSALRAGLPLATVGTAILSVACFLGARGASQLEAAAHRLIDERNTVLL